MRWQFIEHSYALARRILPQTAALFVEWPDYISPEGVLNVYDLAKPEKPAAQISYHWAIRKNRTVVVLSSNDQNEFMEIPSARQIKFKVSHKVEKFPYPPPSPMAVKVANTDQVESLAKLASVQILKATEGAVPFNAIEEWLQSIGQDASLATEIAKELSKMAINVVSPFNMRKQANNKNLYQDGDHIRIMDQESPHYNKGGTVIGKQKDKESNLFIYQVMVDGWPVPLLFHPKHLLINQAGKPGVAV